MNTKFGYMYRDGCNFKTFYDCVVPGEITDEQKTSILDACDGEYFIPRLLGLPGGMFSDNPEYDAEIDHPWCEHDFEDSFNLTNEEPTISLTVDQLVAVFVECSGKWEDLDIEGKYPPSILLKDHEKEKAQEPAGELTAYKVVITETYVKEVEVYAKDSFEAEEIAEELCCEGEIELDVDHFVSRTTESRGVARSIDLELHEVFDRNGAATVNNKVPLSEQIKAASSRAEAGNKASGRNAKEQTPEM